MISSAVHERLYKKKLFDDEAVWHTFSEWILPYVSAADPAIKNLQKDDPHIFCELSKLFKDIKCFEEKKHPSGSSLHILSPESIKRFLKAESE